MKTLGKLTLRDAAKLAAGNWRDFTCFMWGGQPEDADNWAIIYTHNRDSGLLAQSNAAFIKNALKPFAEGDNPDVVFESHSHWAVGHVDGFSIRVFNNGEITKAFQEYHELAQRLADYPILDEDDYSDRELNATLEKIIDSVWQVKNEYELPENWESDVYSWFSNNDCSAIESIDDQGGYPEEEQLRVAFDALNYRRVISV